VHQRLQGFMAAFAQRTRSGAGALPLRQSIWNAHWQGQLERLDSSLRRQLEGGSATDSLYRLRLRSLLAAEEPRLAAILGRALLDSAAEIGTELRSSAWQALVEASLKEENWDDAERHARAFQSAYPDDPALPDILFLGARVAAARSDWEAALRQVALLLEKHPEHTAAPGWRMLRADWLLQSGAPGPALEAFSALADAAPASWQPFLRFQQGRCHEALRDYPAAEDCFRAVLAMEGTTGSLCEAAYAGLLKLFLRQFAAQPFAAALAEYRRAFPDGLSRWTVENLAGTFAQSQGDAGRARAIFQKVAAQPHPEALYARQQLSRLHRQAGDLDGLLGYALDWIDAGLCGHQPLSQEAFADALHYQRATGKTAVPADLARSLHREIEAGHPDLPVNACLELFADQWEAYRESLGTAGPFTEWLEDSARRALREERWLAYAGYQLEAARLFEAAGRPDSADARRIHLLQSVDPALLGEAALLAVARTAHAYDFPEAEDLLDSFLTRFAGSSQRPDALLLLAERRRRRGDDASAFAQLGEIVRQWPDAAAFEPAALRLAAWRVAEGDAPAALAALGPLLDRPGLAPRAAAEALLLRARADFLAGNPERGFLNGLRLLTLYPDFDDTTRPAIALLIEQRDALPHGQQREALSERLQALIKSHEPASTHHSPNA
jgi:TolA-binding protein